MSIHAGVPVMFMFIQTLMEEPGDERTIMKITRVLVNMLIKLKPELYGPKVVYEKG